MVVSDCSQRLSVQPCMKCLENGKLIVLMCLSSTWVQCSSMKHFLDIYICREYILEKYLKLYSNIIEVYISVCSTSNIPNIYSVYSENGYPVAQAHSLLHNWIGKIPVNIHVSYCSSLFAFLELKEIWNKFEVELFENCIDAVHIPCKCLWEVQSKCTYSAQSCYQDF